MRWVEVAYGSCDVLYQDGFSRCRSWRVFDKGAGAVGVGSFERHSVRFQRGFSKPSVWLSTNSRLLFHSVFCSKMNSRQRLSAFETFRRFPIHSCSIYRCDFYCSFVVGIHFPHHLSSQVWEPTSPSLSSRLLYIKDHTRGLNLAVFFFNHHLICYG